MRRLLVIMVAVLAATVWCMVTADDVSWVWANNTEGEVEGPQEPAETTAAPLVAVVNRVYLVIMVIASALGSLFLTIAGVRWLVAGGEPGAIDGAKRALTGVALGYGIAVLATVLMSILEWILAAGEAGGGA
ncbi:hypothetical protein ABZ631_21310 [Nocardiopsis alba]|uniref:hypothetical protein n=1 Tax=Nocardiopsis alba TaxID=53437 RepID=UPI0033C90B9F